MSSSSSSSKQEHPDDEDSRKSISPQESQLPRKRHLRQIESESESDEAPEVLSIVAGKRQIKQQEGEINKFAKQTAQARRQANRLRDEKLKENSKARKTKKIAIDAELEPAEQLPSDAENEKEESNSINATAIPTNKKYLDPSLFASASHILEQSKQAAQARELEKAKLLNSRRKKHKKIQNQNQRDVGNNTTVVHLSQPQHISPAPRPISAANFARNRLYTKPSRSRVKLPKSTLAAKAELGARRSTVDPIHARRAHKPAAVFARSQD